MTKQPIFHVNIAVTKADICPGDIFIANGKYRIFGNSRNPAYAIPKSRLHCNKVDLTIKSIDCKSNVIELTKLTTQFKEAWCMQPARTILTERSLHDQLNATVYYANLHGQLLAINNVNIKREHAIQIPDEHYSKLVSIMSDYITGYSSKSPTRIANAYAMSYGQLPMSLHKELEAWRISMVFGYAYIGKLNAIVQDIIDMPC